jgi:hypothetical protein
MQRAFAKLPTDIEALLASLGLKSRRNYGGLAREYCVGFLDVPPCVQTTRRRSLDILKDSKRSFRAVGGLTAGIATRSDDSAVRAAENRARDDIAVQLFGIRHRLDAELGF